MFLVSRKVLTHFKGNQRGLTLKSMEEYVKGLDPPPNQSEVDSNDKLIVYALEHGFDDFHYFTKYLSLDMTRKTTAPATSNENDIQSSEIAAIEEDVEEDS